MKITIAYLYYDLLNFYGDNGNVKILEKVLKEQGIDVEVKKLSIYDELNFDEYDFVYMGMGINENLLIANEHLIKYQDKIQEAINNNKFFLCTGNSYELFGKSINNIEALNIFNYTSKYLNNNEVIESEAKCDLIDDNIIIFINRVSSNDNNENTFLHIKTNNGIINEGIKYNNFIGTYSLGPILIRNPKLLEEIVKNLILSKDENYALKDFNLKIFEDAYNDYFERFKKNNQD